MQGKEVIIDVGANKGEFALAMLALNPEVFVLAIEPVQELCNEIRTQALSMQRSSDIEVLSCAVDMYERTAEFNVSTHDDQGVSSLLVLSDEKIQQDNYWKTRSDLYFDQTISIQVRRLDRILSELGLSHIAFVKIDAQGLDVRVLRSMGEFLGRVDAGMLEVTSTLDKRLYQGEEYDLHRTLNALDEMGFEAYSIKPNDPASNEFNLFFCRKGSDYKALEERLKLRQVPLYSGKDFWHVPSEQYRPSQEVDVDMLQQRIAELDTEVSRLSSRLLLLEMQLLSVYSSKSWRLTQPLRFASESIGKLLGRGC